MDLQAYFQRIGYHDTPRVDLTTLNRIHHQHLLHIPYENYDVQLSRPLDFDLERIFNKLVTSQRGGWCYEMNGLLSWALQEVGFAVTRMSGAVGRETEGDRQFGNHLVLEVMLDQPYLADTGLGDGMSRPIPIRQGTYPQGAFSYRLEHLQSNLWRFHNHAMSNVKSFDFRHEPAREAELADKCTWLQKDSNSPFRKALILQRFTPDGYIVQLGKRFTQVTADHKSHRDIDDPTEFNRHVQQHFGIEEDVAPIWDKVVAAHEAIFANADRS